MGVSLAVAGSLVLTRVVVNQHAASEGRFLAEVLTLQTNDGTSLTLTPDHAIFIDGKLAARLTNTCLACNTGQIEVVDGWRDQGLNEPQCGAVGAGLSAEFDNGFSFASDW